LLWGSGFGIVRQTFARVRDMTSIQRFPGSFGLYLACLVLCVSGEAGARLNEEQKTQYSRLRREYFVALALPPGRGRSLRKEHRRFRKRIEVFLKSLGETEPGHRAAATFYRAQLFYHYKAWERARKDYDSCLVLCESLAADAVRTPGLPPAASIRFLRAFTFRSEGVSAILDQLEAIPRDGAKPKYVDVGERINRWAEALADSEKIPDAIRAYELIKVFDLWEDEHENPKRKIDLLKLRQGEPAE
jgi:hypothetical protein